jgi:hypothetical protein
MPEASSNDSKLDFTQKISDNLYPDVLVVGTGPYLPVLIKELDNEVPYEEIFDDSVIQ